MKDSEDLALNPNGLLGGGGMKPLNLAAFATGAQNTQPLVDATNTPPPVSDAPRSPANLPVRLSTPEPQPVAGPSRPTSPRRTPPPASPRRPDDSPMRSNGLLSFTKKTSLPEEPLLGSVQSESQGVHLGPLQLRTSERARPTETEEDVDIPLRANGLLGGSSEPALASAEELATQLADVTQDEEDFSLQSNGLLSTSGLRPSGSGSSIGSIPIDPLTQTQSQDALPDIHDLLRPYARPAAPAAATRAPSNPLPRSSVRAHTYDGKPLFIRRKQATSPYATRPAPRSQMANLLDVPLHRLLDELSVSAARRLAAEPEVAFATTSEPSQDTSLWVDRYRPQRYTELLGDERVHRDVLAWVKEWDKCVFGRNSKTKARSKKRAREGEIQGAGFEPPADEWDRPHEKMLLLWGPPGLGKTTLAHVVAKQAGYEVFEINASDARSGAVVDERIRPAVEAGARVDAHKTGTKPVLVVIDEIDGATGGGDSGAGFVHKLIQLAMEKPAKSRGKNQEKTQGKRPLLRPIICICNDLYAPALSKLRPIARIVKFSRPTDLLLVKRLREICTTEELHADTRALGALVGLAQGDMRGCLNTLQMLKAKAGSRAVSESQVRSAAAGLKEAEAGYVAVLNDLFAPLSKKRVMDMGMGEREQEKYVERLARALEGCGAMDRVALGAFEHYAKTHQHDATFARYMKGHNWLLAYDTLSGEMRTEREYALMPYLSYALVPFYHLFQERGGMRVERPKADWENWQKAKASDEIYASVAGAVRSGGARRDGAYRDLVGRDTLKLEFAPYLNRIISPPLRPVNSQVIRPEEKAILSRLVNIMVSLELRFVQEKAEDGQLMYRLDPPVDIFVTYDGKRAADIGVSRYAVRHIVAAEIDAQLIAKQADAVERTKAKPSAFFGKSKMHAQEDQADPDDAPDDTEPGEGTLTNARPAKRTKVADPKSVIDIADKPPVDFFGRPIVVKPKQGKPSSKAQHGVPAVPIAERPYRVSYRFKEGNSAAVRKPVKLASFL